MIKSQLHKLCVIVVTSIITISSNVKTNDFPTLARSEFVFACMSSNASNRDFMSKCSCAIDEIAKRMNYEEYERNQGVGFEYISEASNED